MDKTKPEHLIIAEFIMKCEPLVFGRLGVCEFCSTGRTMDGEGFWKPNPHLDSCIFARAQKLMDDDQKPSQG